MLTSALYYDLHYLYYLHLQHSFVTFKLLSSFCTSEPVNYEHDKLMTSCEIPEIQCVLYILNFTIHP